MIVQSTPVAELETDETADVATSRSPLQQSQDAFLTELPELLIHHRGEWVAFADSVFVRLSRSRVELYRHCLNELCLTHDRFVVRRILPESSQQIEFNLR